MSASDLIAALGDSAVSWILLMAGTYEFADDMCFSKDGSALCIDRNVTIQAEVAGSVVLDAKGARRVIYVSATGRAQLFGLNITGGAVWAEHHGNVSFPALNPNVALGSSHLSLCAAGGWHPNRWHGNADRHQRVREWG